MAAAHPQLLVTATVLTQPGIRHVRQAVPVDVRVAQLGAGAQFLVVVLISVFVVVTVVVWMSVAVTLFTWVTVL